MSHLNISPELNLGSKELNKMNSFLQDEGYEKIFDNTINSFGIIKNTRLDPNFNYFKITYPGTGNIVSIQEGFAYCKVADKIRLIHCKAQNITIPSLSDKFWIKIAPKYNNLEKGTLSIGVNGSIVGVGTEFSSILRGQPNLPSKIRFVGSTLNTQEYEVLEVVSDTAIILAGSTFEAETDLQYEIIGTFTRGFEVPSDKKGVFVYDGCIEFTNTADMGIVRETVTPDIGEIIYPNLAPFSLDEAFFIYRITSDGTNIISIEDHRENVAHSIAENIVTALDIVPNRILGINKVSWDSLLAPKDKNIVEIAWGLRGTVIGQPLPLQPYSLTLNAGNVWGGRIKKNSINPNIGEILGANDLLGWRLYVKYAFNQYDSNHSKQAYARIISSSTTTSSLTIVLDHLCLFDFQNKDFDTSGGNNYDINERVFAGLDNYISYKAANISDPSAASNYNNLSAYLSGDIIITIEGYVWEALNATSGNAPLIESESSNRVVSYQPISYLINKLVFYNNVIYKTLGTTTIGAVPDATPSEFQPIWQLIWKKENQEIYIVPDCEQIEILSAIGKDVEPATIIVNNDPLNFDAKVSLKKSFDKISTFNISDQSCALDLLAFNKSTDINGGWNIQYRYKNNHTYSDWFIPYSDSVGFLKESRINEDYQDASNYGSPYITSKELGWLKLIKDVNSYSNVLNRVDIGDNLGVRVRQFDNTLSNYLNLEVAIDEYWQIFEGNPFALINDVVINLSNTNVRDGNKFYIQFKQIIIPTTFKISIKQNAELLNPGTTGDLLFELSSSDIVSFKNNNGFLIVANYDKETNFWKIWSQPSSDQVGVIEDYAGISDAPGKLVANGRTIAKSGATADIAQNELVHLFLHLWNGFPNSICPVLPSGRGSTAINDWNDGKRLKILDLRSKFVVGFDDTKPATPENLTYPTDKLVKNYGALGNEGGLDNQILTGAESGLPNHQHNIPLGGPNVDAFGGGSGDPDADGAVNELSGMAISELGGPGRTSGVRNAPGVYGDRNAVEASENRPKFIVLNKRLWY